MSSYPEYRGRTSSDENYPYPPTKYNDPLPPMNAPVVVKLTEDRQAINRTPSPTPSEVEALKTGALSWKAFRSWKFWFRKEWTVYYIIILIAALVTIFLAVYHTQIVKWLTPSANFIHNLRFGWVIPIGILFVLSFPPLFGHEIIAILCGLVWGLWVGFAIVAAGTFVGEVGNFYAFKYCCRARGEKLEKTKLTYACLARVVREGGFKIALIARLSLIPGHFTTALFSACGMSIWTFSIAAILSSPKQFLTVYLGVLLDGTDPSAKTPKSKLLSDLVVAITALVTALAMWYILRKMDQAKPAVIYAKRKARQAKLARGGFSPYSNAESAESSQTIGFNPRSSDSEIPLNVGEGSLYHQQWDKDGRAAGYAADSQMYAPQPKRMNDNDSPGRMPITEDSAYKYARDPPYGRSARLSDESFASDPTLHQEYTISPPGIPPPHNQFPTQQQQSGYPPQRHDVMQTPTQAQFGGYEPPPVSADVTATAITPASIVPPRGPYYSHEAEPTGESYHTAYAGHSRPGTDASLSGAATPPNYRNNNLR